MEDVKFYKNGICYNIAEMEPLFQPFSVLRFDDDEDPYTKSPQKGKLGIYGYKDENIKVIVMFVVVDKMVRYWEIGRANVLEALENALNRRTHAFICYEGSTMVEYLIDPELETERIGNIEAELEAQWKWLRNALGYQ